MKKRALIAVTLGLAVVVAVSVFAVRYAKPTLSYLPEKLLSVNYNNYLGSEFDNIMDYRGDRIAWLRQGIFGNTLTILDSQGRYRYLDNIGSPFQLCGDYVAHIKDGDLFLRHIEEGGSVTVARDVNSFLVLNKDEIYYETLLDLKAGTTSRFYFYGVSQKEKVKLHDDISDFWVQQGTLFFEDRDQNYFEVSSDNASLKGKRNQYSEHHSFNQVMPYGENWLLCNSPANFWVVNSGFDQELGHYGVAGMDAVLSGQYQPCICDDKNIFASVKIPPYIATRENANGVWRMEPDGYSSKRLSEQAFDQLYLYEGGRLFGSIGNSIYQIDTETGETTEITP